MPELPDVTVYVECLTRKLQGAELQNVRIRGPALLRTAQPPLEEAFGRQVNAFERLGKRIVCQLDGELFLVLHLMIAGRLRWERKGAGIPGKLGVAALDFDRGSVILTEASSHKRTQLHLLSGRTSLRELDRGGLEVLGASLESFSEAVTRENHTLKRALTDPRLLSGIGNAYSDEILHRARLSPVKLSQRLEPDELSRLHLACQQVLEEWTLRLRTEAKGDWPKKVTAFRDGMAVHGRYGKACPVCGAKVQRIAYAKNETNYCAQCQTGGKLLADRALSRLLKRDWPRTLEELEERKERLRRPGDSAGQDP